MKDGDYTKQVQERFPKTCEAYKVSQAFVEHGELYVTSTWAITADFESQVEDFIKLDLAKEAR